MSGLGRCWDHKGGAPVRGSCPYRRVPEGPLRPSPGKTPREDAVCDPGGGSSPQAKALAWTCGQSYEG